MGETISRRVVLGSGLVAALYLVGCADDDPSSSQPPSPPPASSRVPDPVGHLTWRWSQDPFALGSYSTMAVGASPADRAALAEPIGERLVLAGEATSVEYPSTVHGAWLSGRRAARQVADLADEGATVIVVGAGMAGLSAASALRDDGFDVTVVEGRERVGGRLFTDDALGVPLDLGASWIEGVEDNPIAALADRFDVDTVPTDFEDLAVVDELGGRPSEARLAELAGFLGELLGDASSAAERLDEDTSLAAVVEPLLDEAGLSPEERRAVEWALAGEVVYEFADDLDRLSAWWFDEGETFGGATVLFPGGYGQLPQRLAEGLDVRLGQVVTAIRHGGEEAVVVVTTDGELRADHVVLTVPLGVLQADTIDLVPPLPAPVQDAVDRLGMGLLFKVCLRFEAPFWDGTDIIGVMSAPDVGRWAYWVNLHRVTGEPVLMAFNAGESGRALERLDDDQLVAEAMAVLRAIYG